MPTPAEPYVFDNGSAHAGHQHRALADLMDPLTTQRLVQTGVGDGWRCLEVGAGAGSVARWLAERVTPSGRVLATDVKPQRIRPAPGLDVRTHDITRDPLPEAEFDLILIRLVLCHLPERQTVLTSLRRALKPGGWLQVDEFDNRYSPVLLAPSEEVREAYETFMATKTAVMEAGGGDGRWGRDAAAALRAAGMVDIDPTPKVQPWRGGSPGARLLLHHAFALRDRLIAAGMTRRQLAVVREALTDPAFVVCSYVVYSVHARRPSS